MKNQYTTTTIKSEGYDETYLRFLEKKNKYVTKMMWFAWAGWVFTALLSLYFKG